MLTPEQIRRRALNRYSDFLRSLCAGNQIFPLDIFGAGLSKPKDFAVDRAAIEVLQGESKEKVGFGYEILWEERIFRRLGVQKIPSTVTFSTSDDYVRFLGKQSEVQQFQADYGLILNHCPELKEWAEAKPLKVVVHGGIWQNLLDVCVYLRNHPRPDCFLREIPVVVDTKFIENHKGILAEMLELILPNAIVRHGDGFESRFGFRSKQPLVRARFLDESLATRHNFPVRDFAVPINEFLNLPFGNTTVLVVENELTFLTLPALQETIAIYGAGDAAALLASVTWLKSCRLFYWGDLDSHGFEILSYLRKSFPHAVSILMDTETLSIHSDFIVNAADTQTKQQLSLTPSELVLYDHLVERRILLEQERIPNTFSKSRLIDAVVEKKFLLGTCG